jgi:hypothetical protein
MNRNNVARVLRADGPFNLFAGLVLPTFYRPFVALIGCPNTQVPIYANVLGAALIVLSLTVILVSRHPEQSLAGVTILYWVFIAGIDLPLAPARGGRSAGSDRPWRSCILPSRTGGLNRRVA